MTYKKNLYFFFSFNFLDKKGKNNKDINIFVHTFSLTLLTCIKFHCLMLNFIL